MSQNKVFAYQWHFEEVDEITVIHTFGLNENNESVYIKITDFTPYIYLELPSNIKWDQMTVKLLSNYLDGQMKYQKPIKKCLMYKKRLYYAHKDEKFNDIQFPYLFLTFAKQSEIKALSYLIRKNIYIPGLGSLKLKIHESDANPILQLTCIRDIPTAGWIQFKGKKVEEDDKESLCDNEYNVPYKSISKFESDSTVRPLLMGMDIEVNSSNPNVMPDPKKPLDKVFQISCVFGRQGSDESTYEKYILSLGKPDQKTAGDDIKILCYKTEGDLLEGYVDLIKEKNPQIIIGYNIFKFDIPYMIDRSHLTSTTRKFYQQGFIDGKAGTEKMIKWTSSAYGNQEFKFLDCEGRLFVDLFPLIQRDYKFDVYNLKYVSTYFLGSTKEDLSPKGIFKCYRDFTPKSLGVVAKYCIKDSLLVVQLFEKIQTWIGLCEMAKTCNIPIFYTYTQGQQIKIYSQVYKKCLNENYVVEKDGYIAKESDRYTGAYVFDPVPGLYDNIVSFDFSSLYPTTIIAYNIDYTTLVLDENIPDEKCHIFSWNDCLGCEHDKSVRKVKIKKEDIMCEKRYFRFLKEPKGVIPTLLENLLGARKKTNKQISEIDEKLKTEKITEKEQIELKTLITVLDKRQLAYKVSANSMYGAMGVRRGYLPFLPGAMCTTAKGRQSIEKAAQHLQNVHKAKLVYGDSCTGDTPVILNDNEQIKFQTFKDFKEDEWINYREFKDIDGYNEAENIGLIDKKIKKLDLNSKLTDKQQIDLHAKNIKIWTHKGWAKINRVIRHHTDKKIYRVLTHTGCVDVTEDHSLLDLNCNEIKPIDCKLGTELLHSFLTKDFIDQNINDTYLNNGLNKDLYITKDKLKAQSYYYFNKLNGYFVSLDIDKDNYLLTRHTIHNLDYKTLENSDKIKKIYLLHSEYNDYVYDIETEYGVFHAGIGNMIIKNTDSTYVYFPEVKGARNLWNHSLNVEQEVSSLFPRPMKLAFEEKIYWRYFILTKKRYMALKCDLDDKVVKVKNKETGELEDDIFKRGVLLARRDNSKWMQEVYKDLIMKIFYRENKNDVLNFIVDKINELFYFKYSFKNFVITKSTKNKEDYKVKELTTDPKKREKRLKDLNCTEEEYNLKALPAHIQLAEKIKRRGKRIDSGTRLEYLVTMNGGWDGKLFDKIEDLEYYKEHSDLLRIDYLYYLHLSINPLDEAIKVAYNIEGFVEKQYKLRLIKHKLCKRIENAGKSKINIID